jgi:hypothetical protein
MALHRLKTWIRNLPAVRGSLVVGLGLAAVLLVGVIDYVTGWELDAGILYLVPVSVDDVIREADLMMYDVKNSGKRGVRHATVGSIAGMV